MRFRRFAQDKALASQIMPDVACVKFVGAVSGLIVLGFKALAHKHVSVLLLLYVFVRVCAG